MKIIKKSLLAVSIAAVLASCGGSSSDGTTGNDPGNTISPVNATISGVAAKGIIIDGQVIASELNTDKTVKNANVGSATTDANGVYSLTLNSTYQGGPIQVEVTTDASTLVVCDISAGCGTRADDVTDTNATIDFGEQYKPGSGNLSMTALLPSAANGETLSVQITPFTHMAAKRALVAVTIDSAGINAANSAVSALIGGLDILTLQPVDITKTGVNDNANAVAYAALSASIAELAPKNTEGHPDIEAAINNLAESFKDGSLDADDKNSDDAVIALQEIIDKSKSVLATVGATDTSGVLTDLQGDVDTVNADGGITVTPVSNANAGDSDVSKAKSFLADLRTWGATIDGEISAPSTAFQTQLDLSDAASSLIQEKAFDAIAYATMALADIFAGNVANLSAYVASDGYGGSFSFSAGVVTKTASTITLTGGEITIDSVPVTVSMTLELPADGSSGTGMTLTIKNIVSEDASSKVVVTDGTITLTLASSYTINYVGLAAGTAAPISSPEKISFNFDAAFTQKQTLSGGQLVTASDPITFATTITTDLFTYVDVNANSVLGLVPGSLSATGTVSNTTGDSVDLDLSLSIPNAATIAKNPVNALSVGSTYATNNAGAHLVNWTVNGNTFSYNSPYNNFIAIFNANGSVDLNQYSFVNNYTGPYSTHEAFFIDQPYLLSNYSSYYYINGQGDYSAVGSGVPDYTASGFLGYQLDQPVDAEFFGVSQPLLATVGIHFTVQFDALPAAKISVTGTSTAFEKGNADLTISYGARKLQFVASNNNTNPVEAASVEITNQDNIKLLLSPKGINGSVNDDVDVTINGKVIATVKEINGVTRVEYIDGTFEIL